MGKKIFKITESELINIIKSVIKEEESKIVTNHDKAFDYKKEGDKYYFKGKGKYASKYPDWTLAVKKVAIDAIKTKVFGVDIEDDQKPKDIDTFELPKDEKKPAINPDEKPEGDTKPKENKKEEPKKQNNSEKKGPVNVNFLSITKKVIDKLEGGYYNPRWHEGSGMGDSGETMFGMDRKHGISYRDSVPGKKFWSIIDADKEKKGKKVWKHYYRGGQLESELTQLAAQQIEPKYYELKKKYLSDEAEKLVDSNPKLIFHFSYACWNGPGFFKLFAKKINDAVKKGITDPDELVEVAINSRKNFVSSKSSGATKVIQRGGRKMEEIFKSGLV